jgi:trimeric autotransporter adhesin
MKKGFLLIILFTLIFSSAKSQTWLALGGGVGTTADSVKAVAVDSQGNIYVGGTFTGYLKKWTAATSSWSTMTVNGPVYAIASKTVNELFVGGAFTTAGSTPVGYIAKWNSSTSTWSDLGGGFNSTVHTIYINSSSGSVYAGGTFVLSGTTTVNRIAKLNVTATGWTALGAGVNSKVNAITEYTINSVVCVMAGTDASNNPLSKFDGTGWTNVSSIMGGKINALAVFQNFLYCGGTFSSPSAGGAKWNGTDNTTGSIITNLTGFRINAFFYRNTSLLYVAGNFTSVGVGSASYVAKITSATNPFQSIITGSNLDGEVFALGVQSGKVVAGGRFNTPGNNAAITNVGIGIDELSDLVSEKSFYPNPVTSVAHLTVSTKENLKNPSLQILDNQGRLAEAETKFTSNGNSLEFEINCELLAPGVYFYRLKEDDLGIITEQFIVQ